MRLFNAPSCHVNVDKSMKNQLASETTGGIPITIKEQMINFLNSAITT